MGHLKVFDNMIEEKLLNLHTAYIGKVLSYSNGKATVQPLGVTKQYGKTAQTQSIVSNIPVIESAQNKIGTKTITYAYDGAGNTKTETILTLTPLAKGDLVYCVCAERNITEAKNGKIATPQVGHHSRSDSVVVGIL